jgi:hypothetical protein
MGRHNLITGPGLHAPSNQIVENNSGGAIAQLKVAKFDGFGTTYPQVVTISSLDDIPAGVIGASGGIASGATGVMTALGLVFSVNTSTFSVGRLYTDASGNLTQTVTALEVGQVLRSDIADGIIYFNPIVGGSALPRKFEAVSAEKSIASAAHTWHQLAGNMIPAVPEGLWQLHGFGDFYTTAANPNWQIAGVQWGLANGADTATPPTSISSVLDSGATDSGFYKLGAGDTTVHSTREIGVPPPAIIALSSPTDIYLNMESKTQFVDGKIKACLFATEILQ